ncbi:MAG: hypothetical protein AB7N76_22200 [Planctomycetota bacterium]
MHAQGARLVGPAGFTRDLLLGGAGAGLVPLPLGRAPAPGGSARVRWIADALRKDALRWLCGARGGGWRALQVVVAGRRRDGRIWDPAIWGRLGLRFTDAPLRLVVAVMESRWAPPPLDPELVALVGQRLAEPDPPTGDLLALHRLCERLLEQGGGRGEAEQARCYVCGAPLVERGKAPAAREEEAGRARDGCRACDAPLAQSEREPPAPREVRERALLALSPLTLLYRPEDAGLASSGAEGLFTPLFRGDRAALLSYLAPGLARAWIQEERRRRRAPAAVAQEGYRRAARGLAGYVAHARRRPDAFRPLIAFYRDYVLQAFGGRAPVVEALRERSRAFDRASERDAFLRDAGELFCFGRAIQARVDDALATPFVDRSEEEKVLLSDYHERFREVAPEVEAIRRELQGELG